LEQIACGEDDVVEKTMLWRRRCGGEDDVVEKTMWWRRRNLISAPFLKPNFTFYRTLNTKFQILPGPHNSNKIMFVLPRWQLYGGATHLELFKNRDPILYDDSNDDDMIARVRICFLGDKKTIKI